MKSCIRCLYTESHPLSLTLDAQGICSGCRIHEEKLNLDWRQRWTLLEQIVGNYRNNNDSNYDCIVPVSGARDSFFIVETVKKKLGLNPLLVTYNQHYNTPLGIRNLGRLRTLFDCDLITQTVDPEIVKEVTRATLHRRGSLYWHCLAGQTVFPVQTAVRFKIPLIIWGAHQGLEQVGMFSHQHEVEMTRRYRKEHDLMGLEAEDLITELDQLKSSHIEAYRYPSEEELGRIGVRGIYLGNYLPWDSKAQHERMLEIYSYETLPQNRTFDPYQDCDSFVYSDVHDYLKFLKHGYGKATDHAVREIRWKRIRKKEALEMVNDYQNHPTLNLDLFLEWIGMSSRGFNFIADQHRNPRFWQRDSNYGWQLKLDLCAVMQQQLSADDLSPISQEPLKFRVRGQPPNPSVPENKYQLIGTGTYADTLETASLTPCGALRASSQER